MLFNMFHALFFCLNYVSAYPASITSLDLDNLDTDLSDLKYEAAGDADLKDFSKILDYDDSYQTKKNRSGVNHKKNIGNIKKLYKTVGLADSGSHEDDETFAIAEQVTAKTVGLTGKERRKYRKGTKTRGFHNVHHKDEYKKEKEFINDDITSGEISKVGARVFSIKKDVGAGFGQSHHRSDRKKGIHGKSGYSDKGHFDSEFSGYSDF